MTPSPSFNALSARDSWTDKVIKADDLWAQVQAILKSKNQTLPQTPRRPDVRLILDNTTGREVQFQNPGNHAAGKPEIIPAAGDKTAVMVMIKGATLAEQYANGRQLMAQFDLGRSGFSDAFVQALQDGSIAHLVDEAYGPAPFAGQAEKLVDVDWQAADGSHAVIAPLRGPAAALGARAPAEETVFHAQFHIYVQGTGTTPELVESHGMCVAVSSDWQTGAVSTRPIVPSVARTYYGAHFDQIPAVTVTPDGQVRGVDLKTATPAARKPPAPKR